MSSGMSLRLMHWPVSACTSCTSMVVDRLEGHLTLTSEPGAGTTVCLILPRLLKLEPEAARSNP